MQLNGKCIFVFTDPAAENSIFALVDKLIFEGFVPKKDFLVFSNVFRKSQLPYTDIVEIVDFSESEIVRVLRNFKPLYIFTGTSLNDFEYLWRKEAIKENIKVISFIDHWTNYIERFSFKNEIIFGNEVFVVNEMAKKESIIAGIPEELITVFGNPYYDKVKEFKPKVSKEFFFNSMRLDYLKKTILFISDDIKRYFPKNEKGECQLGFDEYSVLNDILNSLKILENEIDFSNFQFIIKLHPKSEENKFDQLISNIIPKGLKVCCLRNCDPLTINYYSDFVFGMFSNMVIESFLMKKKLLRVQIGQVGNDLIKMKGIKGKVVKDKVDLNKKINNFLNFI